MYRKVKLSERLPEIGKPVIIINDNGIPHVYKLTNLGWDLRNNNVINSPKEILSIEYWLEEVKGIGSKELIGNASKRFKELEHKNWDWKSFYNGWLEGRTKLLDELGYFDAD